ncbi:retinal-specific phospholipid-transporting ATPase ABCA4-like [Leguminivora glycinivorella]|uniref:retinal-specific phospholipid-transporting ATPase ABCA4-like n=1 Tax=Leguminivora glycinivorella TaxID=1035111 RepID=UPI00200E190C|nr:retinal-specific phospholipid-transporting ATPase ABCA4-like [Leguminivora glycinivorella]
MAAPQLRLLLWKDYLVRKRKLVTLGGVIWATTVIFSLYLVRTNVDNVDYKTCQYAARALPSAGVITFLQSFICNVNNDCRPMEEYQQIPTYENSTLTKLQRQFTPLIYNDSVLNVAATVPDALKLLATLADIVDEPTFVSITKHGLRVRDLFNSPGRVRRYLASTFNVSQDVAESIMGSELSFQGIMKGNINRCSANSLVETLNMDNAEHLSLIVEKLCSLTNTDIRKIL